LVGGTVAAARNIISGNSMQGVSIGYSPTFGNVVQRNYIGLNPAGTAAMANGGAGVNIFNANGNLVGGAVEGAGNVISGNGGQGVLIQYPGTLGNYVQGNIIGLNAAGTAAVSNFNAGVEISGGPVGNVVGGVGGARNFISGNGQYGIFISFGSSANVVQGNTIGLNISNSAAIPNTWQGVSAYSGATSNLIGGTTIGAANLISGNLLGGVQVAFAGATNNVIRGNSIYNNNGSGIAIYSTGNNELAAPTLTSAVVTTNLTINGNYDGANGSVYQLDFYSDPAPTFSAEGRVYLGSKLFTGTGSTANFTAQLGAVVTNGTSITATITDPVGNTSQFSSGVAATMTSTVNDGIPDAWRARYFGGSGTTTNSQSYVGGDADHTGMDNFQKFLAGLNPTNPASVFKVTAANPFRSTNAVVLNTANGTVYQLQYRDDLTIGNWQILADQIIGTGTNIYFPDPGATAAGKRFYRALVEY
jgi:parallel beta-helix repeat protein